MKMKKIIFAFMIFSSLTLISCEEKESDEFCSNPDASCPGTSTAINASSCCTDQDCYWTYNHTDYACDGTDCSDVLDQIVADACSAGIVLKSSNTDLEALKAELQAFTNKLLLEARSASGCN